MKTFVAWIQAFAATIGGPGLFIIAFLDSSFVSLPQINDLLVITMVIQHPYWMPYYAAMATAGSVAGCLVLYGIARKGGDALIRRRFHGRTLDRATRLIQKYGVLTLRDSRDSAAAGAVQALRAAGRRLRRQARCRLRCRLRSAGACATSGSACCRSGTASRR